MMLESITRFIVPANVVAETDDQLRDAGNDRVERFVLWSGIIDGGVFRIRTAHVPQQTAYWLLSGLCVRVGGDALHQLNVWLFQAHEQLAIQIHSHSTEAYHSDTDDTYPMVTTLGGLSVVVPDFGRYGLQGPGVAWYRLNNVGWQELEDEQANALIQFNE